PFETDLSLEAGDVLSSVIGDAGNRVAVRDEVPGSRIDERTGTRGKQFFSVIKLLGRMLGQFDDLALRDATDLIQVETTPALGVFRFFRRSKKGVGYHGDGCNSGASHGENKFPVCEKRSQLASSNVTNELWSDPRARMGRCTAHEKKVFLRKAPPHPVFYRNRGGEVYLRVRGL